MDQRGRILRDTNAGPGIVTANGKQYSFTLEHMWLSEIPPRPGMLVDITFSEDGVPTALQAVPDNQIAKEQAQQALAGARTQGTALAAKLQSRFGAPVLVATGVLIVGWFFLDCVSVGGPRLQFTFWQMLGFAGDAQAIYAVLDKNAAPGGSVYEVLALLALIAPFARFFWHDRRAALTGWCPLLVMALVFLELHSGLKGAFGRGAAEFGRQASQQAWEIFLNQIDFHLSFGAYLSLAAGLYLAWIGTRQYLAGGSRPEPRELQPAASVA